eukprot:15272023-Ditylum_brightwellii.AAC.1
MDAEYPLEEQDPPNNEENNNPYSSDNRELEVDNQQLSNQPEQDIDEPSAKQQQFDTEMDTR